MPKSKWHKMKRRAFESQLKPYSFCKDSYENITRWRNIIFSGKLYKISRVT